MIKERQRQYLPYLKTEYTDGYVLELGFGRGELLSLMKENGISAVGVDSYAPFVKYCADKGYNVLKGDALTYLAGCTDSSLKTCRATGGRTMQATDTATDSAPSLTRQLPTTTATSDPSDGPADSEHGAKQILRKASASYTCTTPRRTMSLSITTVCAPSPTDAWTKRRSERWQILKIWMPCFRNTLMMAFRDAVWSSRKRAKSFMKNTSAMPI